MLTPPSLQIPLFSVSHPTPASCDSSRKWAGTFSPPWHEVTPTCLSQGCQQIMCFPVCAAAGGGTRGLVGLFSKCRSKASSWGNPGDIPLFQAPYYASLYKNSSGGWTGGRTISGHSGKGSRVPFRFSGTRGTGSSVMFQNLWLKSLGSISKMCPGSKFACCLTATEAGGSRAAVSSPGACTCQQASHPR